MYKKKADNTNVQNRKNRAQRTEKMKKVHELVKQVTCCNCVLPRISQGRSDLQNMLAAIFAVANTELYISHKLILITYKKMLGYVR
jgi:hypothetical protein